MRNKIIKWTRLDKYFYSASHGSNMHLWISDKGNFATFGTYSAGSPMGTCNKKILSSDEVLSLFNIDREEALMLILKNG